MPSLRSASVLTLLMASSWALAPGAQAAVIANQILAFSNGLNYARNTFYKKVGPRIQSILSTDQGDGLGALFLPYLPERTKEVKP